GYDDAVYAALRLIELITTSGKALHELLADVPPTHTTPELRVARDDDKKFGVVDGVLAHFRATHDALDVDGPRIQFGHGWGLVRASNTQPALVLRFEADSPERRDAIRAEVEAVVQQLRG